jgi:sulfite reductase (ferredoxin)
VAQRDIVPLLRPVLEYFQRDRRPGETFGDYCQRLGPENVQALLPGAAERTGVPWPIV